MVSESSSTGVFRRMNRRERLRSTAPYGQNQQGKGDAKINTAKKRQSKPIEFALLKCCDDDADDEDDEHHLKWNSIIANGMIMAEEDDREENIRKKLKESLVKKFEIIGENDFEFVKVRQKKLTVLDLGTHTEYGYPVVKKMAGQGLLYIKIKQGYDFVYNSNYSKEEDEDCLIVDPNPSYPSSCGTPTTVQPATGAPTTVQPATGTPTTVQPATGTPTTVQPATGTPTTVQPATGTPTTVQSATGTPTTVLSSTSASATVQPVVVTPSTAQQESGTPSTDQLHVASGSASVQPTSGVPAPVITAPASVDPRSVNNAVIQKIISEGHQNDIHNPVQILSVLQKELIHGRKLDLTDGESTCEGETNYICVNREDILKTTFMELESITDFCMTFEVDFMGEMARDMGGPRKEWIRCVNCAIKEKYFDHGLLDFCCNDYFYVGLMMGIALLQNGQLPKYLPEDIISKLVVMPITNSCVAQIQNGLQIFGFVKLFQAFPTLLHLLRPSNEKLAPKLLMNLLSPMFSPDGSTAVAKEKQVYAIFVHYVRQVASGRRDPISLNHILEFVTGASEEPVLGFAMHPTITFTSGEYCQVEENATNNVSYFPTAHTCSNTLVLPRGPLADALPEESQLYSIYDLAFSNLYFGAV